VTTARDIAAPPTLGLRERKKAQAMDHIQDVALDLFEERGFDAVTIEEIATAADVSARSIYRYFETKEGLVLRDALDDQFLGLLPGLLSETTDLFAAARLAIRAFSGALVGEDLAEVLKQSNRRLAIWYATPNIRLAAFGLADEMAGDIAAAMVKAQLPDRSASDCQIQASALVFGFFAALEEWFQAGQREDVFVVAERVLDLLGGPRA
jgi:AcrR family transcriptional regulator